MNARTLARVVDDAEHIYLERFLRDKYGLVEEDADDADTGELTEIIEAELASESVERER